MTDFPRGRTHDELVLLADPQLREGIAASLTPALGTGPLDVDRVRRLDAERAAPVDVDPVPEVHELHRADGSVLAVRVHRPRDGGDGSALLWIHGGGMILGSAERDDASGRRWADGAGVIVAVVDYRLAPEHPHPAPLDDCTDALEWLLSGAAPGVDPSRVAVGGASAGGGLALALALRQRDRGRPGIRLVHAIYPMIDDRPTPSARELADAPVWNARLAAVAWAAYLGGRDADEYAAPARAADVAGLPPVVIDTAELDMFRDENVDFARRLFAAGVACELHVEPRTVHGYDGLAPDADVSRRAWERRFATVRATLSEGVRD